MKITPDEIIFWTWGWVNLNLTILTTWGLMALLVLVSAWASWWAKRKRGYARLDVALETVVIFILRQLEEVGLRQPRKYLAFIGSLFCFLACSAFLTIFPGYIPPTGSLSTTAALALCVFIAVPLFGIREQGLAGYLKSYMQPTLLMLPFNIIGDLSRTLALAVRLFGNMMSGTKVIAIIISIMPLIFPVFLQLLGLLTGMVQAYIFAVLATVYIAAATRTREEFQNKGENPHGS